MSKHDRLIEYIESLKVGTKISVRNIALNTNVSEGTAYRAIKHCEDLGLVTSMPRRGTVRIEKLQRKSIDILTYAEIVNIVEGTILGGKIGIHKTLNKFVIGAMTIDAMEKYINPGNLLIVGNREDAQRLALLNQSAVLITGGFTCSEYVKKLANEKSLPIISSRHDTFTVASMINKAISENRMKKHIILVEDIMKNEMSYVETTDIVEIARGVMNASKVERLPVVDVGLKVVGIVSYKEIASEVSSNELVAKVMNREVLTVSPKDTVAIAAQAMAWEDIEICPVVEDRILVGIITRQEVIAALQCMNKDTQIESNMEDVILKNFQVTDENEGFGVVGKIVPEMLDSVGTASWSSLNMLLSTVGIMALKKKNENNIFVDSIMTYFIKPVQLDSIISINTEILDTGRSFCKIDISMVDNKKELMGKAMLSAKVLKK